ncbi:hypothetical protein B4086_5693 [Bacillus cereus]|nr:hypothetical protein B4086_5693 [Bacillus cereus]
MSKQTHNTVTMKEERKVVQVGNSQGVFLPKSMLEMMNLSKGDEVTVEYINDGIVVKKKPSQKIPEGLSPDFLDVLGDCLAQHDEVMKELVDK